MSARYPLTAIFLLLGGRIFGQPPDDPVHFYINKVKPLLTARCYACHTQAAMGGLRLDLHSSPIAGLYFAASQSISLASLLRLLSTKRFVTTNRRMRSPRWSTGFWLPRAMASGGAGTGWMSPVTPTRMVEFGA